jgi:ATP-dependent helicase/nuclease subunit B
VSPSATNRRSAADGVGSVLWLVPTQRAADRQRRRLARLGRPILLPKIHTFQSFAAAIIEEADETILRDLSHRLTIEDAARQLAREGKLDYFRRAVDTRGFIEGAEGFLGEVDAANVSIDAFQAAVGEIASAKLAACAELYTAVGPRANPLCRAAQLVRGKMPPPFEEVKQVIVDGFTTFTAVEWRLLESLFPIINLSVSLPDDDGARVEAFAAVRATRARLASFPERKPSTRSSTRADANPRPNGIEHLANCLFGKSVKASATADGMELIEAPGELGEARLIARRIRSLIATGTRPDDILVTVRDLGRSADLLDEVFAEYGMPVEIDGDVPLMRNPAVATLVRAIRLADEDFPFAGLTALLRSTYFRPAWPEADIETILRTERLLRLLGLPRNRESYLRAVRLWSETPPVGLEDEQVEESRRLRKARLAADCRPFVERLLGAWDNIPARADPPAFAAWGREFALDIGLLNRAESNVVDRPAIAAFLASLDRQTGPAMSRTAFLRMLGTIAATETLPRSPSTAGQVRIVPAEEARHLDCDYLFIIGLGENSFPRLGPPASLLDDSDRIALRAAGLPLDDPASRLGEEELLFLQLIARPRHGLVLSYPATDERGQPLLPGSFLRAALDCFAPGVVPVEHQRMVIQGYMSRPALSPTEARVQFACRMRDSQSPASWRHPALDPEICEQLRWASEVSNARFAARDYNAFDGRLQNPAALAEIRERFGPEKVFSPTALESYVACPFRFFMEHVLGLEELQEPGEEVEQTRRGAAYHRALSRLHDKLNETPDLTRAALPDRVNDDLLTEIDKAVGEYAERAPSPAAKKLWELEGKRLYRSAGRYRDHWDKFLDPWRKEQAFLSPRLLEADFGFAADNPVQPVGTTEGIGPLVIEIGGIEVRIGGRIDRVDVAELGGELGFWIIDYKTGRSANYSSTELSRMEKLQLSLYALAVERVFFPGRVARPLGLAYWLVTDEGAKPVLPGARSPTAWLADPKKWAKFREQLEGWVAKLVERIRAGQFPLAPRSDHCTDTCSYGQVCRISQSRNVGKTWDLTLPGS